MWIFINSFSHGSGSQCWGSLSSLQYSLVLEQDTHWGQTGISMDPFSLMSWKNLGSPSFLSQEAWPQKISEILESFHMEVLSLLILWVWFQQGVGEDGGQRGLLIHVIGCILSLLFSLRGKSMFFLWLLAISVLINHNRKRWLCPL